jgi:hypothetical protein
MQGLPWQNTPQEKKERKKEITIIYHIFYSSKQILFVSRIFLDLKRIALFIFLTCYGSWYKSKGAVIFTDIARQM